MIVAILGYMYLLVKKSYVQKLEETTQILS